MINSDFTKQLDKALKANKRIPQRMATMAVNFSKERFVQKNWLDTKREPWKDRQDKNAHGSLMLQSGKLKRSIRKIRIGRNYSVVGSDVKQAQILNDGGVIKQKVNVSAHNRTRTIQRQRTNIRTRKTTLLKGRIAIGESTVKAHTRQMNTTIPARTFLAPSKVLGRRIERQIVKDYEQALK